MQTFIYIYKLLLDSFIHVPLIGTMFYFMFKNENSRGIGFWVESLLICFSCKVVLFLVTLAINFLIFTVSPSILTNDFINTELLTLLLWFGVSFMAVRYASNSTLKALTSSSTQPFICRFASLCINGRLARRYVQ